MTTPVAPLKKELRMEFDAAVARVRQAMETAGFAVMMVKSVDEMLHEKLGVADCPRYTIILGCVPQRAHEALAVNADVGLLMPCSFAVYETEGRVMAGHVSIMKIAPAIGLADAEAMAPVIAATSRDVQAVWERL